MNVKVARYRRIVGFTNAKESKMNFKRGGFFVGNGFHSLNGLSLKLQSAAYFKCLWKR